MTFARIRGEGAVTALLPRALALWEEYIIAMVKEQSTGKDVLLLLL
jgi:hypothetical protein